MRGWLIKKAYIIAWTFIALTIFVVVAILVLPLQAILKLFLPQMAIVIMLHLAAGIIFLLGIKGFRERLQKTYLFLCGTLGCFVLALIQILILLAIPGAMGWPYVIYGGPNLLFMVGVMFGYLSMVVFARQIEVKSLFTKSSIGIGMAIAIGIAFALIPSPRTDAPTSVIAANVFISATGATLPLLAAYLAFRLRHAVSLLYQSATWWLGLYFITLGSAIGIETLGDVFLPDSNWFQAYGVSHSIFNISAAIAIVAALKFNRIAYAEQAVIQSARGKGVSSVDVAICLSQLASSMRPLEPTLDKLRILTASLNGGDLAGQLSEAQQRETARICQEIRDYLVYHEPVRKYNADQLEEMIAIRFKESVQEPIFWAAFT